MIPLESTVGARRAARAYPARGTNVVREAVMGAPPQVSLVIAVLLMPASFSCVNKIRAAGQIGVLADPRKSRASRHSIRLPGPRSPRGGAACV